MNIELLKKAGVAFEEVNGKVVATAGKPVKEEIDDSKKCPKCKKPFAPSPHRPWCTCKKTSEAALAKADIKFEKTEDGKVVVTALPKKEYHYDPHTRIVKEKTEYKHGTDNTKPCIWKLGKDGYYTFHKYCNSDMEARDEAEKLNEAVAHCGHCAIGDFKSLQREHDRLQRKLKTESDPEIKKNIEREMDDIDKQLTELEELASTAITDIEANEVVNDFVGSCGREPDTEKEVIEYLKSRNLDASKESVDKVLFCALPSKANVLAKAGITFTKQDGKLIVTGSVNFEEIKALPLVKDAKFEDSGMKSGKQALVIYIDKPSASHPNWAPSEVYDYIEKHLQEIPLVILEANNYQTEILGDEITGAAPDIQSPVTTDDKSRILKAVLYHSGSYLVNLPGYVAKQFSPADVGVTTDKAEDGERYRDKAAHKLTDTLIAQLKFFTPEEPPKKAKKIEIEKKLEIKKDDDDSEAGCGKSEAAVVNHVVEECPDGVVKLIETIATGSKAPTPMYHVEIGKRRIASDSDATRITEKFEKAKKMVKNFLVELDTKLKG